MESLHSYYQNDDKIIIKVIASICLGSAILSSIRRINNHAATATATNNCCNNPSCIRCHSTSQQHAQFFKSNVVMLRRLVQLEPELFGDMRSEIWEEVARIEQQFESKSNHHNTTSFSSLPKQLLLESLERIRQLITPTKSHETEYNQEMIPLSPQEGQDPTVFFLKRLEALPLHNIETCTKHHCPCIRLWKELPLPPNAPPVKLTGDIVALKTHFTVIREELFAAIQTNTATFQPFDDAVYQEEKQQEQQQAEWSSIYLYRQGIKQTDTCRTHFPITTNILETMCPHRMGGCGFGSVYFSKLKQNTKVVEHCGPTNVRLRCHLPLSVPIKTSGSCLRVGEHCVSWEEGKPILFDDSFLHSAVYAGNDDSGGSTSNIDRCGGRIVLIVDFWHPSLSTADRTALSVLYPPGS